MPYPLHQWRFSLLTVIIFSLCISGSVVLRAQVPFRVRIEPISIEGAPALHSGVVTSDDGKWLFIGGRTNGLHGFQGLALFPEYTQNSTIYVVDPTMKKTWSASTEALPIAIREHINSSNMQWIHKESQLIIIGGYGYSASKDNFITFPAVTQVNVPDLIAAVTQSKSLDGLFRHIVCDSLAVCGGRGGEYHANNTLLTAFGHRFDGIYNKNDSSNSFQQVYTSDIRRFSINENTQSIDYFSSTTPLSASDSLELRRRDYNLVPQFDGINYYHTAYSGVFRKGTLLPHTDVVDVFDNGEYIIRPEVQQKYAHYECATMPIFNKADNSMHTVFFGGMAMYSHDSLTNTAVADTNVPFVPTISVMSRTPNNVFRESVIGYLPNLLGTNATFIPLQSALYANGILKLLADTLEYVGYIVGGIVSPKPNISEEDAALSSASTYIFKVWLDTRLSDVSDIPQHSYAMNAYQSSSDGGIMIDLQSAAELDASIRIVNLQGETVLTINRHLVVGRNLFEVKTTALPMGFYFASAHLAGQNISAKFLFMR